MSQELNFVETCLSMLRSLSTSDEKMLSSPGISSPLVELNLRDINAVSFMNAIRDRPLSNDAQAHLIRLYERVLIKLKGASMEKFAAIQRRWGSARRRVLPRMEQLFKLQCQLAATRMQQTLLDIVDERLKSFQEAANESTDAHRGHSARAVAILEKAFEYAPNITQAEKYKLAEATGLQPRQVTIWFQNRRNRRSHTRRSSTVDQSFMFPEASLPSGLSLDEPPKPSLDLVKTEVVCDIDEDPDFGFEHQESETESDSEQESQRRSESDHDSEDDSDIRSEFSTETPDESLPVLPPASESSPCESSSDPLHDFLDNDMYEDNVLDMWSPSMPVTSILDFSSFLYPSLEPSDKVTGPSAVLLCQNSTSASSQLGPSASMDDAEQYLVFSPVDSMPRLDFADLDLDIEVLEECFGLTMEPDYTFIRIRKVGEEEERAAEKFCSKPSTVAEELERCAKEENWDLASVITCTPSRSSDGKETQDMSVRLSGISSTRSNLEETQQRLFSGYPTSPITPCLPPYASLSQGYVAPSTQTFDSANIISPSLLECSH